MKQFPIYLFFVLALACKKTGTGTGGRVFNGPNPATEGDLLIKEVSLFPDGDSSVVGLQYDAAKRLTAMPIAGFLPYTRYFYRDAGERIVSEIVTSGTAADTFDVHYTSTDSDLVSYTIHHAGPALRDSAVYTYNQAHYTISIALYSLTVSPAQLSSVDSLSYDANGNIVQSRTFQPGPGGQLSLNLGYEYEYDTEINPLYSPDDCRIPDEGAAILSPNNILKQTNHYGDPPVLPSDYVTMTYQYRTDQKPSSSATGGTAIGPGSAPMTTYYYQ